MTNAALIYALKLQSGDIQWDNIPKMYRNAKLLTLDVTRLKQLLEMYYNDKFAEMRDDIRWVGEYGYDCATEDITIFLAAYTYLKQANAAWEAAGFQGDKPLTPYKVYKSRDSKVKSMVNLTIDDMEAVYKAVNESQAEAYAWLEGKMAEVAKIESISDFNKYVKDNSLDIINYLQ